MSAPSDGARADARKRLAESIGRLEGRGNWYTDAELAGVIADAKAEALREAARTLPGFASGINTHGDAARWLRLCADRIDRGVSR